MENTRARSAAAPAAAGPLVHLRVTLERMALAALTTILSVNCCVGFPLIALWVGSRFAFGDPLSMGGIVIAIATLGALMAVVAKALTWLSNRYDRITGRPPAVRQPPPWMLSMRASQAQPARGRREVNAIETIVVMTVVAAFITFEIWFFFFASPVH